MGSTHDDRGLLPQTYDTASYATLEAPLDPGGAIVASRKEQETGSEYCPGRVKYTN